MKPYLLLSLAALLLPSPARAQSDAAPAPPSPLPPASTPAAPSTASPPPAIAPGAQTPAAIAPEPIPAALPESDRGARGESCRARVDCKTGLACVQNVCRLPAESSRCETGADCAPGLACANHTCLATAPSEAPAPPASSDRPFTIDLDTVAYQVSAPTPEFVVGGGQPVQPVYSPGGNQTYLSTVLGIRYTLPNLRFETEIPYVLSGGNGNGPSFGNLAFAIYHRRELEGLRFEIGAILALPTAPADSTVYEQVSPSGAPIITTVSVTQLSQVFLSRGADRAWLWVPHYFTPLAPSARLASADDRVLQHATELTFAPMIATDAGATSVFVLQLSEEVAAHASIFRAGARAELVGAFSMAGSAGYLSFMPFAGIAGKYGFLDLGALFDLVNPPAYATGNASPNWGLRVRSGLHF